MSRCDRCGEMLPDGTRFCPFCGAEQIAVPAEKSEASVHEEPTPKATDTDADVTMPMDADDNWRPFRYERPARTARVHSRSILVGEPALRVLAAWLAAVIVIAVGVFWYVWTGNNASAQATLTLTSIYRSEASLARLAGPAPDFSHFLRL